MEGRKEAMRQVGRNVTHGKRKCVMCSLQHMSLGLSG